MIGAELFRLPNLPEGAPEEQLRAIRNYLFQLSEQLQYAFSHTEEGAEIDEAAIRSAVLRSAELVGTLAALAGKRLEDRYIDADRWETDRRGLRAQWAQALCRLAALEDRPAPPEPAAFMALCQGDAPGYQRQTGDRVYFTPLDSRAAIFEKQPDGHWRIE